MVVGAMVAIVGAVVPGAPAHAAGWHNISGSVYSNTNWYTSATIRVKEDFGTIEATFHDVIWYLPLRFGVRPHNLSTILGWQDFNQANQGKVVASGIANGYLFRNSYRRTEACSEFTCDHNFAGQERY